MGPQHIFFPILLILCRIPAQEVSYNSKILHNISTCSGLFMKTKCVLLKTYEKVPLSRRKYLAFMYCILVGQFLSTNLQYRDYQILVTGLEQFIMYIFRRFYVEGGGLTAFWKRDIFLLISSFLLFTSSSSAISDETVFICL